MPITIDPPTVNLPRAERVRLAAEAGEAAFWEAIAAAFPDAESPRPPDWLREGLRSVTTQAVLHWTEANVPEPPPPPETRSQDRSGGLPGLQDVTAAALEGLRADIDLAIGRAIARVRGR